MRALFVYEERNDSSLVIGAGIKSEWLNFPKGISADNLPTYYGTLSYYIKKTGKEVRVGIKVNLDLACKRIILKSPLKQKISSILIDGKESHSFIDKNIYLKPKSQSIVINYEIL